MNEDFTVSDEVLEPTCGLHNLWTKNAFINECDELGLYVSVVLKPPYEVTETGWGEFEIIIKIYFNDPTERPVS